MALGDFNIKVQYRYTYLDQKCENVQRFRFDGAVPETISFVNLLEAIWNNIKTPFRACFPNAVTQIHFDSLFGTEDVSAGLYAEFPIPSGEKAGTRTISSLAEVMPSYATVGVREVVGTRLTRPGQKRFNGLLDVDVDGNALVASAVTLFSTLASNLTSSAILGAPAAGVTIVPIVGGNIVDGLPLVSQDVTGYILSPYADTQVSRKINRGS